MSDFIGCFKELDNSLQPGRRDTVRRIVNNDFIVKLSEDIFIVSHVRGMSGTITDAEYFRIDLKTAIYIGDIFRRINQSGFKFNKKVEGALLSCKERTDLIIDLTKGTLPEIIDDIITIVRRLSNEAIKEAFRNFGVFMNQTKEGFMTKCSDYIKESKQEKAIEDVPDKDNPVLDLGVNTRVKEINRTKLEINTYRRHCEIRGISSENDIDNVNNKDKSVSIKDDNESPKDLDDIYTILDLYEDASQKGTGKPK